MQHQQKTQLAQRFSQLSDLTTKQQESLSRLSRFLDERPLPPHFQTTESTQTPAEAEVEVEAEPELFLPQQQQQQQPTTIDTLAQFHEWFSEVESAAQSAVSTLESDSESDPQKAALAATLAIEYPRLNPQGAGTAAVAAAAGSRALQGYACEVARAQGLAERWEGLVRETSAHCVLVRERASSIRERACAMSAAQAESEALAEALETRIRYFDQLYPLTRRLYAPGGAVAAAAAAAATANTSSTNGRKSDGTGLGNTLEELDQCVDFMQTHRSYKEAEAYLTKYRQLQARALTALKTHVVETLRGATTAIEQQQQLADSQAASAQRMRTAPSSSSRQQVLAQQQLAMQADRHIGSANSSAAGGPLPRLLPDNLDAAPLSLQFRILAARLRPQCAELEKRAVGREYGALLGDCHSCYFHQRKVLLQARVQETLRWLAGDGGNSSSSNSNDLPGAVRAATAFALRVCRAEMALFGMFFHTETPLLAKLVESIAQSLQFVLRPLLIRAKHIDLLCAAAVVLRDDSLAGPDADGPLRPLAAALSALAKDAQERITYLAQCVIRDEIAFFTPSDDDLNYPEKLLALQALSPKTSPSGDDQADLLETVQRMYATWYPSLQRTLMLLSKIYLTVDMGVFEGLAAEAIEQCLGNLLSAKDLIKERKGFVDSQLFLIKHLLTLREQVAPFEASFTETQVSLDFSSAKAELRKLLAGGGGIGQLLTPNVFVPQVSTSTVDSLQKVVRTLTAAVEEFVVHVTKTLAGDLLSFLVQVSSFEKVSNSNSNGEAQLKDQAWAAPDCLERIAQDTTAALREKAPMIAQELLVYMPQAQAGTIFSPIRDSIVDSWEQFLLVRNKVCQSGEGDGSIGEAAEAEAQQPSKFLSVQEVQKTLDEAILKN